MLLKDPFVEGNSRGYDEAKNREERDGWFQEIKEVKLARFCD